MEPDTKRLWTPAEIRASVGKILVESLGAGGASVPRFGGGELRDRTGHRGGRRAGLGSGGSGNGAGYQEAVDAGGDPGQRREDPRRVAGRRRGQCSSLRRRRAT